jgi:hypothetical protein
MGDYSPTQRTSFIKRGKSGGDPHFGNCAEPLARGWTVFFVPNLDRNVAGATSSGVSNGAVFQVERGISCLTGLAREPNLHHSENRQSRCLSVTDMIRLRAVEPDNAPSEAVLRIHHERLTEVCCLVYGHHGRLTASRVAAQKQTYFWFHEPLQPYPSRVLRMLLLSRCRD